MHGYPGVRSSLGNYPADRVAEVASGQNDDLVVRVYGADLATLQHKAQQIRAMLSGVSGVARPVVKPIPMQPTADIQVNLAAAQRYGLRPGDVRREATTLTSGLIVGNLYEQSKIFDVVVWGAQRTRSDLTQLGNLLIDTPSGGQVPLRDVATVKVHAEPAAITHDDVARDVEVAAKVTGDPSSVVGHGAVPDSRDADALRVPRRGVRERDPQAGRPAPDPGLWRRGAGRHLPADAGGRGQLAAGGPAAGVAAPVSGGRRADRAAGRRNLEHRIAGRAVRRVRAGDPQRGPARAAVSDEEHAGAAAGERRRTDGGP